MEKIILQAMIPEGHGFDMSIPVPLIVTLSRVHLSTPDPETKLQKLEVFVLDIFS